MHYLSLCSPFPNTVQTNTDNFVLTGCRKKGRGHGGGNDGEKKGDNYGKKTLMTVKKIKVLITLGKLEMNVPVTPVFARMTAATDLWLELHH
jgi:hypothetical protein